MTNRWGARTLKSGRNAEPQGRFARLDHKLSASPAYRSLNPTARALLVELAMMENGKNNGSLWLSVRDAAKRLGLADAKAIQGAFSALADSGFLAMTCNAYFNVRASDVSRARCWRLTWLPVPGVAAPTNEWVRYTPADDRAQVRAHLGAKALASYRRQLSRNKFPVVESSTLKRTIDGTPLDPVVESSTRLSAVNGNEPRSSMEESSTHTAVAIGRAASGAAGGVSNHENTLRTMVADFIAWAGAGSQTRLASQANVPPSSLSRFLAGKPLNAAHRDAIKATLAGPTVEAFERQG